MQRAARVVGALIEAENARLVELKAPVDRLDHFQQVHRVARTGQAIAATRALRRTHQPVVAKRVKDFGQGLMRRPRCEGNFPNEHWAGGILFREINEGAKRVLAGG